VQPSHKSLNPRSLHCAPPDFLWKLVASASFMRLSLVKGAHVLMSNAAWQEIRVRSGRDDNFAARAELSREIVSFEINLSSRPKRSAVEGPAVNVSQPRAPWYKAFFSSCEAVPLARKGCALPLSTLTFSLRKARVNSPRRLKGLLHKSPRPRRETPQGARLGLSLTSAVLDEILRRTAQTKDIQPHSIDANQG
jgi:hypothetical protein